MPVLGYDTAGGSATGDNTRAYGSSWSTDGLGGNITTFHVAVAAVSGVNPGIKLCVNNCSQVSGSPNGHSLIEQVEFDVAVSDDESVSAPVGESLSADTKYWLAQIIETAGTTVKYDSVTQESFFFKFLNYATEFPDIRGGTYYSTDYRWSIWVDYRHPGVLGYDTPGASNWGIFAFKMGSSDTTDGTGGNITMFHCAIATVSAENKNGRLGVYNADQDTGSPVNKTLVEQVEIEILEVSDDNSIAAPEGNELLADTKYFVVFMPRDGGTKLKYDDGGAHFYRDSCTYGAEFVSPWQANASGIARIESVWVDYEEAGGQEYIRSIADDIGITDVISAKRNIFVSLTEGIGITDFLSRVYTRTRSIADSIGITDVVSRVGMFIRSIFGGLIGEEVWSQQVSSFGTDYIRAVCHNKSDLWIIVGAAGKLATSPDGRDWTQRDSKFGAEYIRCVGYSIPDSLWIIGGPDKSAKSSDGINWELFNTYIGSMHSVVHNGLTGEDGLWVAVGAVGKIRTSPDAVTWTPRSSPFGNEQIWDVAYSVPDSLWVIVANNNKIATSSDGFDWTTRTGPFGSGDGIEGVAYNGVDLWVCVADYGKLATSPHGINWTPQDSGIGDGFFRGVDHDQVSLWIAVASPGLYPHQTDNIVSSSDGINWVLEDAGFGTDEVFGIWHNKLSGGNSLWVAVGKDGKLAIFPFKVGISDSVSGVKPFVRDVSDSIVIVDILTTIVTSAWMSFSMSKIVKVKGDIIAKIVKTKEGIIAKIVKVKGDTKPKI